MLVMATSVELTMSEPIAIIVTLFEPEADVERTRLAAVKEAIASWRYLEYDGPIVLMLTDDCSLRRDYMLEVELFANSLEFFSGIRSDRLSSRSGVGASLNHAIEVLQFLGTDVFAYFVDDWILDQPLDINGYVKMLREDEGIGMVRIGTPHPDLTGTIKHSPYGWHMILDRHHYAFGFRPALYHMRMTDVYGPFKEGCSSWDCETEYNARFNIYNSTRNPGIALALPDLWHPLYPMSVGELEPANVR